MKPLDFVKTPKGNMAIVQETNHNGQKASIWFIGKQNPDHERNAWWSIEELEIVDNLSKLLSVCMAHPFGSGRNDAEEFFKI